LRLMAVHAHPDDESSKGAATMARYVSEGVDVLVVTCTGGERGEILNPKLVDDPEILANLPEVRRAEMDRAREILGVRQEWLGFVDSGYIEDYEPESHLEGLPDDCFARLEVADAAAPLVALMRSFRPHVVTTYDERGGYPHPDHIMCHEISVHAFEAAPDPEQYPEAGEPWQPLKLYYQMGFHKERFVVLHEAVLAAGLTSPYEEWLAEWVDRPEDQGRVTTLVPCASWFPVRDEALKAHATQVDADSWWFGVPLEIQEQAWPTEDYQLARSLVDTQIPEDDLFAGLRSGQ
jgi:mycothiol S-conjugate amidase